jgi:hypothetical protein
MPMLTIYYLQALLFNFGNFQSIAHVLGAMGFLWFIKFLVKIFCGGATKEKETTKEKGNEMEYTINKDQDSTKSITQELLDYFEENNPIKVELIEENILEVALSNDDHILEIRIEVQNKLPVIIYYGVIIKDFPDNRLFKLTEFIVRLNRHFIQGKFGMIMEERQVTFELMLPHNNKPVLIDKHANILQAMKLMQIKYKNNFENVAYNSLEPVAAVMEALAKSR